MSEKFENLLNLALETGGQERSRTSLLNTGYDSMNGTWEVIVKYHGDIGPLQEYGIRIEELIAGYGILTVPETEMDRLAEMPEIEYVEIPKSFYYQAVNVRQEACIAAVTAREPFLTGEEVLIAVLDSGIDMQSEEFRNVDGSTRIVAIWDQSIVTGSEAVSGLRPPEGFYKGVEIGEAEINSFLIEMQRNGEGTLQQGIPGVPLMQSIGRDTSGHGTAVAGIAAGRYTGVAPGSRLLIVKMDSPQTADVMRAVTYALRTAAGLQLPLVINLSLGNTYGSHDGTSLLERFLDNAAEIGRTVIVVGAGNEGNSRGHYEGVLPVTDRGRNREDVQPVEVEIAVDNYQPSLSIQLWKNYRDEYNIYLQSPGGSSQVLDDRVEQGKYTFQAENTEVLAYLGEPIPYSTDQEILVQLIPANGNYINSGLWKLILEPVDVREGSFSIYLPSYVIRNEGTGFTRPSPTATFTIPSTASKVITVGAYNSIYENYADFSGRGYAPGERENIQVSRIQKPDLAAPGVDLLAPAVGGGYRQVTGTSFAAPIVSGSAALLMEWGIVRGNDDFLYGEKMKAYLQRGAGSIRGEDNYPNERVGWGALCVRASLPI